ncbi:hypothetical protein GCM10022233_43080 [Streptomyces shaanxiensis]|uniref:Uncharacterized protein n=1 Tax=Streptomyces shaanxiensis TaxID=653357 RepID=A0ABP7VCW6_9ACTN
MDDGVSKEQAVFSRIGDLVSETIMPSANASAFYKAAAKIPGVQQIPDAAGRHGIAVTREDASSATRDEWIFDKDTLGFLGSRSYITQDEVKGGTSDTLFGTSTIMERTVVDQHGKAPADQCHAGSLRVLQGHTDEGLTSGTARCLTFSRDVAGLGGGCAPQAPSKPTLPHAVR